MRILFFILDICIEAHASESNLVQSVCIQFSKAFIQILTEKVIKIKYLFLTEYIHTEQSLQSFFDEEIY